MLDHNCELKVNSSKELNDRPIASISSPKNNRFNRPLSKFNYININQWIIFILLNSISAFFIAFAYSRSFS